MADGALVLVDAAEGPMPQTRFVLTKALECRLQPMVVINKIDRPDARPQEVLDEVFDLFLELGADDELADFPVHLSPAGARATPRTIRAEQGDSMQPLLDLVLERIPGPEVDADAPLQMLVTTLDWSDYVGRIAVGRIHSGRIAKGQQVALMQADDAADRRQGGRGSHVRQAGPPGSRRGRRPATSWPWSGWKTSKSATRSATPTSRRALPRLAVDEPTLQMIFSINSSPLGRPRRQVRHQPAPARAADQGAGANVALRVEPVAGHRCVRRLRPRPVAPVAC